MEEGNPEDQISKFIEPGDSAGHPPMLSEKRKTATKVEKKPQPRVGDASTLETMFGSANDPAEEEATEYDLPLRPADGSGDKTQPSKNETIGGAEQADTKELSNEARVYWARYADLSKAHDEGRYDYCRDGCFDLLLQPNLPKTARIQTLHMVSTITKPAIAQGFLEEARSILNEMDSWSISVQELKEETDQMLEDLELWRGGKDSAGNFNDNGDGPSEAWFEHDQKVKEILQQNANQEREWLGLPKLDAHEDEQKHTDDSQKGDRPPKEL